MRKKSKTKRSHKPISIGVGGNTANPIPVIPHPLNMYKPKSVWKDPIVGGR